MNWFKEHTKLLLVVIVIITIVVLLAVVFLPSIFNPSNSLRVQYYDLNQEIAGFPVGNTSMTFTSWVYTSNFGIFEASENTSIVLLNFTLRNIAASEIETSTNLQYLPNADSFTPREAPLLKYGDSYSEAKPDFPYSYYWGLWTANSTLPSNGSVNGYLIYEISKESTPAELVFPNADSPQIIIKLQ